MEMQTAIFSYQDVFKPFNILLQPITILIPVYSGTGK
jgi:hypothetical protein